MIWLTPFNQIQLAMHTPINISLERIVLPVIASIWLIARTAGPGAAPRLRLSPVHVAIGVFVACAFLSVVLDARYLNQVGEFTLSFKKLPLLVSYVSIFVIVASSVRRTEVPAFMKFTLVLAVIFGAEMIYEYRFKQNLFITWTESSCHTRSSSLRTSAAPRSTASGGAGSPGPAGSGVEAITMLSMALRSRSWDPRREDVEAEAPVRPRRRRARRGNCSATQRKSSCWRPPR